MADVLGKAVQQTVHGGVGALLAADVQHNMTVVHHQRAVAQGQRVVHVVGDHQAGQVVFGHDLFRQFQHLVRRGGIQGGGVLVQQQQFRRDQRGHQQGQCLALAAELQAQLDKQKYDEGEDHDKVCAIATVYGTWSNAGDFTPDDAETAWDADSLTEYLGSDALRGKDMVLALDGEDSPYLNRQCLLKDAGAPVGKLVQKLFVLDKNNMASPETARAE